MKNDLSLEGGRGRNLCVGGECYNEQLKAKTGLVPTRSRETNDKMGRVWKGLRTLLDLALISAEPTNGQESVWLVLTPKPARDEIRRNTMLSLSVPMGCDRWPIVVLELLWSTFMDVPLCLTL